jgi:hypothetical protein
MTDDLNEICGLGITRITGLAEFSVPATFRLRREENGSVHLTTDAGISLTDQWMRQTIRCVEAMTIHHQWVDVTKRCSSDSIPSELVQDWSERNNRTLVEFRINA